MPDPIAVLLKFAFIGILYVFLVWVVRSALRDLRQLRDGPARDLGERRAGAASGLPHASGWLILKRGGGRRAGASFEIDGGVIIGRSPDTDVPIEDRFASGRHARIFERDGCFYIEDMGSTNGTYLNSERLDSPECLQVDDSIRIGETEFRYEERG